MKKLVSHINFRQSSRAASAQATPEPTPPPEDVTPPEVQPAEGTTNSSATWSYDPNEPRYCICNEVSYGDMIGCDNEDVSICRLQL